MKASDELLLDGRIDIQFDGHAVLLELFGPAGNSICDLFAELDGGIWDVYSSSHAALVPQSFRRKDKLAAVMHLIESALALIDEGG